MSFEENGAASAVEVEKLAEDAIAQGGLGEAELLRLVRSPLDALCAAADSIRERCCGNDFELCSIMNVKSGHCSENCRFCAQSSHWGAAANHYPFAEETAIVAQALRDAEYGSRRFSLVASGQRVSRADIDRACSAAKRIRAKTDVAICVSFGLLEREDYELLRRAGVTRVHNNLETSRSFFPRICTTHGYDRKITALRDARAAGMELCSGGIIGLGETWRDRIEMALELRRLEVASVPINVLNPIPGTPLEHQNPLSPDDVRRTFALFRFALPSATLRLAGGRTLMPDAGRACLKAGVNAAISGDMLTTAGFDIPSDIRMVTEEGFFAARIEEDARAGGSAHASQAAPAPAETGTDAKEDVYHE